MAKTKEQRRAEALERQSTYDAQAPLAKLSAIAGRPGQSARERGRVLAAVA